jgi:tetratricopeptide (TPR) repeat protein
MCFGQEATSKSQQNASQDSNPTTSTIQTAPNDLDVEILSWIEKLGSESYSERLEAQGKLETFGSAALDWLRIATEHQDPQIASQARFMVQSGKFSIDGQNTPFELRKLLDRYEPADFGSKARLIRKLGMLDKNLGVRPLCRIARFESNPILAKIAAIELLRRLSPFEPATTLPPPADPLHTSEPSPASDATGSASIAAATTADTNAPFPDQPSSLASIILETLSGAKSQPSQWLRIAFERNEKSEFSIEQWLSIVDQEEALFLDKHADTSLQVLEPLMRWVTEQASLEPKQRDQGISVAKRLSLITANRQLAILPQIDFCEWALRANLPEIVPFHYSQTATLFPQQAPVLLNYLLAESFSKQNKPDLAKQVAKMAKSRQRIELSKDFEVLSVLGQPLQPPPANELLLRSNNQDIERAGVAEALINRGSFEWAEAELRESLSGREDSPEFATILTLTLLSQMLHELDRDAEASEVLKKFAHRYENERLFQMQTETNGADIPSNYHLFAANDLAKNGKHAEARESYSKAIELAPDNVDALIGLARLPENEEEKQMRLQDQSEVVNALRKEIEGVDQDLRLAAPMFQTSEKRRLANQLNTFAWLVANTQGDQQEALLMSRRACALAPDRSAYLDTLAHCFEKQGDFESALRAQRKAVALEPHQPSLQRALKRFEEKAKEKRSQNAPATKP